MTPEQLIERLGTDATVDFETCIQVIAEHFDYTPCAFDNGELHNAAGQNEGSCKLFAFGQLMQLSPEQTLASFGRFYRDVLATPEGDDHANIRNFMRHGWAGVSFAAPALRRKD